MSKFEAPARRIAELVKAEAEALGDISFATGLWKAAKAWLPRAKVDAETVRIEPTGPRWAARLMLFDPHGSLEADSEPDRDLDQIPRTYLPTLRACGRWAREGAESYHAGMLQGQPVGLDDGTIEHKLLTARVTISRNKGHLSWWKLAYVVDGAEWTAQLRLWKLTPEQLEEIAQPAQPFRQRPEPEA